VEGAAAIDINATIDRFGYVSETGFDANSDGILDITILGGIWVASGIDVATPGNLPSPATGNPKTLSGSARLEFAASPISGFTSALNVYSPAIGFGWLAAPTSFVRSASMFPANSPLTATEKQFYGSAAYGSGDAYFAIAVPAGNPNATYSMQVYVADPYSAWQGITVQAEGTAAKTVNASVSPPTVVTLTGIKDANGDGLIWLKVTGSTWVMNGIDVTADPIVPPAKP
jgi:hypothetical protein